MAEKIAGGTAVRAERKGLPQSQFRVEVETGKGKVHVDFDSAGNLLSGDKKGAVKGETKK